MIEEVARAVHNTWMAGRLAQGWVYGPERNDRLRQHPCLVDYEALTEEERDYDRATALSTLSAITACGYKITKEA